MFKSMFAVSVLRERAHEYKLVEESVEVRKYDHTDREKKFCEKSKVRISEEFCELNMGMH